MSVEWTDLGLNHPSDDRSSAGVADRPSSVNDNDDNQAECDPEEECMYPISSFS
jgi:hypothetical protein